MSKTKYSFLLIFIALCGFFLRLQNYDHTPPFGETMDEFMYPFAGISLLTTGTLTSWSPFMAYQNSYPLKLWDQNFRIVTPWLDKPPLYPLLAGTVSLMRGEDEFSKVRMSTFRLIPVALSFFTILLVGLVAAAYFHPTIGLLSSMLYATIPTIVLGNRLGLTENLMVPLTLLGLWLFHRLEHTTRTSYLILLGIVCGATVATKQIGITLPLALIVQSLIQKKRRTAIILALITVPFALINPLMGYFSDWTTYQNVMREFNWAHTLGLPEMVATLFRVPGIGHKESIFYDGAMLLGFILFFSSPFWILKSFNQTNNQQPITNNFLLYPFTYLTFLSLLEGGTTWYGWHLFPLYPFLAILVAYVFYEMHKNPELPQFLTLFVILGASSYRFFMLIHPEMGKNWQTPLAVFLCISVGIWFLLKEKPRRIFLAGLFVLFIFVNIYTVLHLPKIYPTKPQPISQVPYDDLVQ